MGGWSGSIQLNQGQGATVRALVVSSVGVPTTITVDQPPIQIVSIWDGTGFQNEFSGMDSVSGYGISVGDGEISYLLNYVADADVLSTVNITAQVKEASVSLTEG